MRIFVCLAVTVLMLQTSIAQITNPPNPFERTTDISGKPLMANTRDIEGSPFLSDNWSKGIIELVRGAAYKDMMLKFNLETNELYFENKGQTLAVAEPVKQCTMMVSSGDGEKQLMLRSGFPVVNAQDERTLYVLLADGKKLQLVKHLYVKVEEIKSYSSGTHHIYVQKEVLYVYNALNKKITFVKSTKSSLEEAVPAYKEMIEGLINDKGLKIKSEKDLVQVIGLLNESATN